MICNFYLSVAARTRFVPEIEEDVDGTLNNPPTNKRFAQGPETHKVIRYRTVCLYPYLTEALLDQAVGLSVRHVQVGLLLAATGLG